MDRFSIRLFGKLTLQCGEHIVTYHDSSRAVELFAYLLLFRQRWHPRESLASLFWNECSTSQSKKYLRKTLWQLQSILDQTCAPAYRALLDVQPDCICVNSRSNFTLDISQFENACVTYHDMAGKNLNSKQAEVLEEAVKLYRGDLLEGWFQDWCLLERERLKQILLTTLDKLMGYCEASCTYEAGLNYGQQILLHDRAREYTHRQLMRLYYLGGDRTGALRQSDRCRSALSEELGVEPMQVTVDLYEEIRASHLLGQDERPCAAAHVACPVCHVATVTEIAAHLRHLQTSISDIQDQLQQEIESMQQLIDQAA